MTTRDKVLTTLEQFDLKEEGPNCYRSNRPWSPGSDSNGLTLTFDDDEHGAYFDHVTGSGGSLYQLAGRLNITIDHEFRAEETKKTFAGLDEYAAAHGATAEQFQAAGWKETRFQNRPALEFTTQTGKRWRFLDGDLPAWKSAKGYKRCWYGLDRAVVRAHDSSQALILSNGEPSVISAQAQYLPACCITSGERADIPKELFDELVQAWQGPVILAPDCDTTGREWAHKWLDLLTANGYKVRVVDFHGSKGFDLADFIKLHSGESDIRFPELPDLIKLHSGESDIRFPELPDLEEKNNSDDTWQVFTLEDALKPRPERVQIVEGILDEKTLVIPYGAPGCLKTLLYQDEAACVVGGIDFLPPLPNTPGTGLKTVQVPVMWIDFDMGEDLLHERFAALMRGHNLEPDLPLFYYSMPEPWLAADNSGHVDRLIDRILNVNAKVVYIDHLKAVSADVDENSDRMQIVMSNFRRLITYTGAACSVIHHQRKSSGSDARAGDRLRGHGSIEAALDFAFLIERNNLSSDVTVTTTKARRNSIYPFGATFTYEHDEKGSLKTAKFFGVKADDQESDSAIDQAILDELKTVSVNQSEIITAVKKLLPKVGLSRIRTRIQRLENFGNITSREGLKNAIVYSRN